MRSRFAGVRVALPPLTETGTRRLHRPVSVNDKSPRRGRSSLNGPFEGFALMGSSKDFGTNLWDVWADAQSDVCEQSQRLRSIVFRSLVLKAWRRLRATLLRPSLPIKNAPLLATVAAFNLMHVFAGAMLINDTVAVVRSTQSEAQQSVGSNRNDDPIDQAIIRNGVRK